MLRNIVFDMGNVLITYNPELFIRRAGITNPADREMLLAAIFRSPDWPQVDAGQLTETDLIARVYERLPERLHDVAHQLVFQWNEPLIPVPGMREFIQECKQAGLGVYLLSNASYRQKEYWNDVPGSEYFDGAMVSAFEGCLKPSAEIFERLFARFGLKPEECLFVDDVQENVNGAMRVGMKGFLFEGRTEALREFVRGLRA